MGLSEKLALQRAKKEQVRAERQLIKAGKSAKGIALTLSKDRTPILLKDIQTSAELFDPNKDNELIERLLDKPKYKAMYKIVKEELEGDWIQDFKSLLAAVPANKSMQAQSITWDEWQSYGKVASLDEKSLFQGLQVIHVFRKAMDPNQIRRTFKR